MTGRDRAASPAGDGAAGDAARRAVGAVWRIEARRIVTTLTRHVGDFALAEDLAQEALADALRQWPVEGVPANGGAWLTAVAKRKAIDHWRRRERLDARVASIGHDLELEQREAADAVPWDLESSLDDQLRLMLIACHPVLGPEARVALTLRTVAGLTTDEIAAAFLVAPATIQQRIVRAKRALTDSGARFELPEADALAERLPAVLACIYLVFTEGHAASAGDAPVRADLVREALRLGRALQAMLPREPEVHGLLALMELTAARMPARVDPAGRPVLLADQDRTRWDRSAIERGRAALARADALRIGRGVYAQQAAIAEQHAIARRFEDTDWHAIVDCYDGLLAAGPSPIVELNRAVAVAMADGPAAGLAIADAIEASGRLADHHLVPSVRGELLARLGRVEEAREALEEAARRTRNASERAVLLAKAATTR
ncbi:RNA polymerase sigma factor [Agrococcus sp. SGAir0287]|uniref:RNA polymerase sigma factor n=1 Tax=Agrococcus sp. SGAir0287 TaxID=2070347 RepID=UPI001C303036|nr:sigma-70 family RNA polymerase sigma factor [Agrococcus sp. SGAir0287]